MSEAQERAQKAMADLGLTVESIFVPYNASRNFKPDAKTREMSLNWQVTLLCKGRPILTTDYSAGIGSCPSYDKYNRNPTVHHARMIDEECRTGRRATGSFTTKKVKLDPSNVVYSLLSDSSVLDSSSFEEWARDLGYDTDSRKAEATYRACLEIALKLRNGIGEANLKILQEAFQDY